MQLIFPVYLTHFHTCISFQKYFTECNDTYNKFLSLFLYSLFPNMFCILSKKPIFFLLVKNMFLDANRCVKLMTDNQFMDIINSHIRQLKGKLVYFFFSLSTTL